MSRIIMYDTVTIDTVPANPAAVAGYVNGSWPTYNGLVAKFPNAHHLDIAVSSGARARCLDVEPRDATPSEVPGWLRNNAVTNQGKPVIYTSASMVPEVLNVLRNANIKRDSILIWSAHYGAGEHICGPGVCPYPQADGTQFTSTALGRNLDASVVDSDWWAPVTPAFPYERFAVGPFKDERGKPIYERATVHEYDTLKAHPFWNRRRLRQLQHDMVFLRKRVWYMAHHNLTAGAPPHWGDNYLGWRWQQLNLRTKGVK